MVRRWTRSGEDRALVLAGLILVLGLALRVAWLLHHGIGHAFGEAENAALAVARGDGVADVFARGSGASAHLNPVLPAFAGTVYGLLGAQSTASEVVLAAVALSSWLGATFVFFLAATAAGVGRWAGLAAVAAIALLPLNFNDETITYRVWEGALATCVGAFCLLMTIHADRDRTLTSRAPVLLFLAAAVLFWINPALGLAAYFNLLILFIRSDLGAVVFVRRGVIAAALLVMVLTPWAVRNFVLTGEVIPLRSNAGLELAVANHHAAAEPGSQHMVFLNRLREVHPLESQAAFDRMRQVGGEIAYARQLGREAQAWIGAHPFDFLRLCIRHAGQFYFPPSWQWSVYGAPAAGVPIRLAVSWLIGLSGLIGAVVALVRWRGRMTYLAVCALVPALPYLIVQPVLRYRYIVLLPLVFLATEVIGRSIRAVSQRRWDGQWTVAVKSK